jgi:hypothetical protein
MTKIRNVYIWPRDRQAFFLQARAHSAKYAILYPGPRTCLATDSHADRASLNERAAGDLEFANVLWLLLLLHWARLTNLQSSQLRSRAGISRMFKAHTINSYSTARAQRVHSSLVVQMPPPPPPPPPPPQTERRRVISRSTHKAQKRR